MQTHTQKISGSRELSNSVHSVAVLQWPMQLYNPSLYCTLLTFFFVLSCCRMLQCVAVCCSVLQCAAVCCSVLQCVAMCCSVLQCVAVCCSVLQRVAVCCSVLQCVAACCSQSTAEWLQGEGSLKMFRLISPKRIFLLFILRLEESKLCFCTD